LDENRRRDIRRAFLGIFSDSEGYRGRQVEAVRFGPLDAKHAGGCNVVPGKPRAFAKQFLDLFFRGKIRIVHVEHGWEIKFARREIKYACKKLYREAKFSRCWASSRHGLAPVRPNPDSAVATAIVRV